MCFNLDCCCVWCCGVVLRSGVHAKHVCVVCTVVGACFCECVCCDLCVIVIVVVLCCLACPDYWCLRSLFCVCAFFM